MEKESLEKIVLDCLRRFDKEHGSCSRSDLEEIVEILRDIQTTAHNLLVARVNDQRRLFDFPLLAELSEYRPTGSIGMLLKAVAEKIYRVHFRCAVCGERPEFSAADKKKGHHNGYRLVLYHGWTKHLVTAFKLSLVLAQVALLAAGIRIPSEVAALCSSALGNLRILDQDTVSGLRSILPEAEIQLMEENFLDAIQSAAQSAKESLLSLQVPNNPPIPPTTTPAPTGNNRQSAWYLHNKR